MNVIRLARSRIDDAGDGVEPVRRTQQARPSTRAAAAVFDGRRRCRVDLQDDSRRPRPWRRAWRGAASPYRGRSRSRAGFVGRRTGARPACNCVRNDGAYPATMTIRRHWAMSPNTAFVKPAAAGWSGSRQSIWRCGWGRSNSPGNSPVSATSRRGGRQGRQPRLFTRPDRWSTRLSCRMVAATLALAAW